MGRKLRKINLEGGLSMEEKACEYYECSSCGKKMVSANFVTGVCIQVFVSHGKECKLFLGNEYQRTREVTCETCHYYNQQQGCIFEGTPDNRMESVRTAG